jgi:hypothetical protein
MSEISEREKWQFFDDVLAIHCPGVRAHERHALRKKIGPRPIVEILPARLDFFIGCSAKFPTATREEFVAHLENIGIFDADKVLEWNDGRPFQFITFTPDNYRDQVQRLKKYTFSGARIKVAAKVQKSERPRKT